MNMIYQYAGISKQNFHQRLNRQSIRKEEEQQLLVVVRQIREDHPRMGAKVLYSKIRPEQLNRDQFIAFYNAHEFRVRRFRNYRRTTDSSGVVRFENLLLDFELTGVNQVLVSDITYYELGGRFYYMTFIMDLFSRKIKGYAASQTLRTTDTTIPAAKMVLRILPEEFISILHSDGGGQYYCKEFLELCKNHFRHSMCETVYENAHAERVNGTIKNDYILPYAPKDFKELKRALRKAVDKYNNERPHQSLGLLTPNQFEQKHLNYEQNTEKSIKEKRTQKEKLYHYNLELNMT